jgi:HK97 family phage major capsid protein
MAIDTNRATTGVELPLSVSNQVLQAVSEDSAVMQLSNNMTIPGSGIVMDVITGDPTAAWVSEETAEKAVSNPGISSKKMVPYTLAVIVPFSNQFKRDKSTLYNAIVNRIPNALAQKFDSTVLHGTAPGANFDTLADATAVEIATSTYTGLVTAQTNVSLAGGDATGWVLAPQAKSILLNAVDGNSRPIFIDNAATQGDVPELLAVPAYYRQAAYLAGTPNTVGFVGDFSKAWTGVVESVKVEIADQATITIGTDQVNLWQRNMFAIRAEMECGFVVQSTDYFAKLTAAASA